MTAETVARGHPCPTCGRSGPDARDLMSRLRARTQLTTLLAREPGLTTEEIIQALTGTRPVSEVLAARDARVRNAPPREEDQ